MDKEYFVLALANRKGEYIGPRGQEHQLLGKVVLLFTTEERLKEYAAALDENQAFMDILERAPGDVESEDINLGGYVKTNLRALAPKLEAYDIDHLLIDYLSPGGYNRVYLPPHRA
jgi:hypothetical protein